VVYHKFDSEDSHETIRYALGWYLYMIFFFAQSAILIATSIAAWVICIRLILFLRPVNDSHVVYGLEGEVLSDEGSDDEFRTPYEYKRDVVRR